MKESFIIDAHMHVGPPGVFFAPQYNAEHFIALMDKLNFRYAVCTDGLLLSEGNWIDTESAKKIFDNSQGRIYSLCVFDPNYPNESLKSMKKLCKGAGVVGIKIHPSFHRVTASSSDYEPAWEFAADNDLTIMTHSWSVSGYNPVQKLSRPLLFERFVKKFHQVRFVLGHFGGRGTGRYEAVQMVNDYRNVYGDFAGDIFDYRLIESLVETVPHEKILFGSDFPWLDPRSHLSQVLFADVDDVIKKKILYENAVNVYKVGEKSC